MSFVGFVEGYVIVCCIWVVEVIIVKFVGCCFGVVILESFVKMKVVGGLWGVCYLCVVGIDSCL